MLQTGNILIVEDDTDDKELLEDIITELGHTNKIIWKANGQEALSYLCSTDEKMLVIFCDINMPVMNGMEFKRAVNAEPILKKKSIPFVFYSTSATKQAVDEAYTAFSVQGFFRKENDYKKMKSIVNLIIEYWKNCIHPNA